MGGDASEARRKRIIDRGSDRLAFITGAAQNLPPPLPAKPDNPPPTDASVSKDDITGPQFPRHEAINQMVGSIIENNDGSELLQKLEATGEFPAGEAGEEFPKCKLGKEFPRHGRNNEVTVDAQGSVRNAELSSTPVATDSLGQVDATHCKPSQMSRMTFTPSQISHSISETENFRVLCAVVIAVLVVLYGHGYSLGGSFASSLFSFRPLFLVLLTDVTVVLGQLLNTKRGNRGEEEVRTQQEGNDSDVGIASMLEIGMLSQKAMRAAFMDCSICAVIMICGLVV